MQPGFGDLIDAPASSEAMAALRGAETIGRPLRSPAFLNRRAPLTGRDPRRSGLMSLSLEPHRGAKICQPRRRSFLQSK